MQWDADMAGMRFAMSKTVRGEQIVIRISGPLRAELEQLADRIAGR